MRVDHPSSIQGHEGRHFSVCHHVSTRTSSAAACSPVAASLPRPPDCTASSIHEVLNP
jgi:hypothetical protein